MAGNKGRSQVSKSPRHKGLKVTGDDVSPWVKAAEDNAAANLIDEVPEGWKTMKEIADQDFSGMSLSRASTYVRELVEAGTAEKKQFRIKRAGSLHPRLIPHYRLKG